LLYSRLARNAGIDVQTKIHQANKHTLGCTKRTMRTRMWANAQRDGHSAEYRWRPVFNAAKFG